MFPAWQFPPLRGQIESQPWGAIDWYHTFVSLNRLDVEIWQPQLFPVFFTPRGGFGVRLDDTNIKNRVWYDDVDGPAKYVADSLASFLESIAEQFEAGFYHLVDGQVETAD